MEEVSATPLEKSRKAHSAVLQALQQAGKQGAIAVALGVSDSTISRTKTEKLEDAIALIYHAGFKVVSQSAECYPAEYVKSLHTIARMYMANARQVEFHDDE